MVPQSKTLVVGPAWVGDMVMAQTLFKVLKAHEPHRLIDVLAPPWTKPLLERMPEVHQAIESPFPSGAFELKKRYCFGKRLRSEAYDWAIVLPNAWKAALVPFFARIPRRTGWLGEYRYGLLNDIRSLDKEELPLIIQRFMALGLQKGAALPASRIFPRWGVTGACVQKTLDHLGLSRPSQPLLVLCPGAEFGPAKRWPEGYYAEVARAKLAEGWAVWLLGSPNDQAVAQAIGPAAGQACLDLIGKTTLNEAIDLMSLASAVVANDSGLMHVAAALDLPLVAVYGPTSPDFAPPLSDKAKVLRTGIACSPCSQRDCPLGHSKCMTELSPARVLQALNALSA